MMLNFYKITLMEEGGRADIISVRDRETKALILTFPLRLELES